MILACLIRIWIDDYDFCLNRSWIDEK